MDWNMIVDQVLKWLVPFICGACAAGIAWLFRTVLRVQKTNMDRDKAVSAGLIALLAAA